MGVIEKKIQDKSQKINEKHEQIQETAKKGLDKIVDKIESQSEMARCNKVGMVCHTIVSAAIGIAYLAEFAKGSRTLLYVLLTIVIGIASPVAEWIVYKKDKNSTHIKHLIGYGFAIFYIFIMFTTNNKLAFTYVIPMLIAITVYNDYKYSIPINTGVIIINIAQVVVFLANGTYTMSDTASIEIQVLVIILISLYCMYTSKTLEINSLVKLKQIEKQSRETERILNNTMEVSGKMAADIENVNSKILSLGEAINATREAMAEVNTGSTDTADAATKETAASFSIIENNTGKILINAESLTNIVNGLSEANKKIVDSVSTVSAITEEVAAHASDTFAVSEQNNATINEIISISNELKVLTDKLNA
mgnify:CR=1 FL=1